MTPGRAGSGAVDVEFGDEAVEVGAADTEPLGGGRLVAALALAPLVQGLLLQIPVDWASSSEVNISWTNTASDSVFALQLVNTDEFHDTFSIANNLQPSADFASFQLGVIPEGCVVHFVRSI